ncbi:MAG: hypothetical protein QUS07_05785, partial [Methanothrix sp.]|nr:hypothetical protein [Methanothrix sp.]
MLFVAICFAIFVAGCVEQENAGDENAKNAAEGAREKLTVTISSPNAGEILQGDDEFSFDAVIKGGREPYEYSWSSSIDGVLSTSRSFSQDPSKLSKGGHVIILKVTDATGSSGQGSVQIEVM